MGFFKPNIEKMEEKGDIKGLIKALKHGDSKVRRNAANALGKIGEPVVEPLIQSLKHNDTGYSAIFIKEDGTFIVSDGSETGLSSIGEPAVEPLIQALKDKNPSLRARAALVLGMIRDARAVEPLIQALQDEDESVLRNANMAIRSIGEPAMEPLIKDEDWYVRQAAALALGVTGDARAVEPIIQALKDEDFRVRVAAVSALEMIGDTRAFITLTGTLKDENEDVREAAKAALEKIRAKKS